MGKLPELFTMWPGNFLKRLKISIDNFPDCLIFIIIQYQNIRSMKNQKTVHLLMAILAICSISAPAQDEAPFEVVAVPELPPGGRYGGGVEGGQAPLGYVEIQGLSAGPFNPEY